ncbi:MULTISPECIES: phosphatase PAP2 family protein [unclassified Vibrio]|uniref:phosphatase PAP2 family protein n=1 Tax=unclassified Vibrio TaxID=2614977 RepID=UPI0018D2F808|nr:MULTISPECIES: phosphatase PAP2 family protein [unclassified Vibrio]
MTIVIVFSWLITLGIIWTYGDIDRIYYDFYLSTLANAIFATVTFHACYLFLSLLRRRHPSPLKEMFFYYKYYIFDSRYLVKVTIMVVTFSVTSAIYTSFKLQIPSMHPFSWDNTFYLLDKSIHFGISPWEITHRIIPGAIGSWIINIVYNLWFFIFWCFFCLIVLSKSHSILRYQAFLAFNLCWIVNGCIVALAFSSVGPCFFEPLVKEANPYANLMLHLSEQNQWLESKGIPLGLPSLATQDLLLTNYLDGGKVLGSGISAFPSLHVSIAVLIALVTQNINSKLSILAWANAGMILVGSIHLGWHYAVDGYFSIVTTYLIWVLVRQILKFNA